MSTFSEAIEPDTANAKASVFSGWLETLDYWCERLGDNVNPILVKESRQALKSRQFLVTFSLLLFAALAWTIIGSFSMMPQIYTTPSAPRMMIGYYVLLALPMLLVVPLAAYRSLEAEIDDGTFELLSITTLSPWQIVLGKLASASLQMLLYFVTLFPCLAYAYSLRGVDLSTTLVFVIALAVSGLTLTVAGLFFAPLAKGRTGRILTLLALIGLLIAAEYSVGFMVISMINSGNPLAPSQLIFAIMGATVIATALGHLLLSATAAQLTPETENRSTGLRLSLLMFTAVIIVSMTLSLLILKDDGFPAYVVGLIVLAGLWSLCGALIVGEDSTITPRIRRELPSSFLARFTLTWLTPGPTTGLIFAIGSIAVLSVLQQLSLQWISDGALMRPGNVRDLNRVFGDPAVLYAAYLICFLVLVRWLMYFVRLRNRPRAEVGFAGLIVVALVAALAPYSMQLHYNDYQPLTYDPSWQVTNWAFTLYTSVDRGVDRSVVQTVTGAAFGLSMIALVSAWRTTQPQRIATPERVRQELEKG